VPLPTFFIIGAAKAGTTALYSYLDLHPEIEMSPIKEPDFFADPNGYLPFGRVSSLAAYERLFKGDAKAAGEASHTYSVYPLHSGVPDRIHQLVPDARMIYLVRDPVDRLQAWYRQNASWQRLGPPREALGDLRDPNNEYIRGGMYMSQIERYVPVFGADRLLVIDQTDLLTRRRETLEGLFAFIGVAPDFWTPAFEEAHNLSSERVHMSRGIRRIVNSPKTHAFRERLPSGIEETLRRLGKRAVGRPIPEHEFPLALIEECRGLFCRDAAALREFTGLPLADWSV
jgi:hypothetical protein